MDCPNTGISPPSPSIPFSFFVSLLSEISKTGSKSQSTHFSSTTYPALQTFQRWIVELHRRFGSHISNETTVIIFHLLFPEDDVRRKYDMQEPRLAHHLARALGFSSDIWGRGAALNHWSKPDSLGCLGTKVMEVMQASATEIEQTGTLTLHEIDSLLNRLASLSSFSHDSVHTHTHMPSNLPHSRTKILRRLFSSISPIEASFLTQIILKDLRPILYPVAETHYTAALKQYKSNAITMLTVHDALKSWDPSLRLLKGWRLVSCLEEALNYKDDSPTPIFTPLQIPKTIKGTGCAHALRFFRGARRVWAETKYDGERAQIHVKIDQVTGSADIKIFSKSTRDSTKDRLAIHSVIRNALGLAGADPVHARQAMRSIERDIIIEAEMVAFSDLLGRIDEFWRIRSLIKSTGHGPRRSRTYDLIGALPVESQTSLLSDASDGGNRHLALVFFDILLLDSVSLVTTPYSSRRKLLESVVLPIPGYSMIAERSLIDLQTTVDAGQSKLRAIFARVLSDHQEGLVLKAEDGQYIKSPWVKLKKDYIPSLGDCLDCVIVGARWDRDRGRELRVPPSTCTTFYLGLLANEKLIKEDPNAQPHFEIFFTVSYGLNRDQLEDLNFMVKSSDSLSYDQVRKDPNQLNYTYTIFSGLQFPDVVLKKHALLLTEVFGAGFTKAPHNKYYELRFPRMTKVFRRSERSWMDGSSLEEFQHIARETVGRERPGKELDDWCKELWGKPISPSVKHPIRRQQRENTLLADLENADKKRKRVLNEDDDEGSVKRFATQNNESASTPQPLAVSRALRPLDPLTNIAPSKKQRVRSSPSNSGSNQTQKPLPDEQSNIITFPPPLPLLSLTTTPIREQSSKVSLPVSFLLISSNPLPNEDARDEDVAIPMPPPVTDLSLSTPRQRAHLNEPSTQTRVEGRRTTSVATFNPRTAVPWSIPPPPPPGASGWRRCANGVVGTSMSNSDQMALYNGATAFYVGLPRWEPSAESLERSSRSEKATSSPVSPDEIPELSTSVRGLPAVPRAGISPMFQQQDLLFARTAVGKLMVSSIVWFAQGPDTATTGYRPHWFQLVPQTNKVTRLEALLVGCGWHMLMNKNFGCKKGIERGVAFIDFEEEGRVNGQVMLAVVVKKCEETWDKIVKWKGSQEMKPIWVVDARMLTWDVLEGMKDGDGLGYLEQFVLWRKG